MASSGLPVTIDTTSTVPPFEQLRAQIARLVSSHELAPGTRLPTVRQLGQDLGLAANTVARSYRELEADGVLVTAGRRGTFVSSTTLPEAAAAELASLAEGFAATAREAGVSLSEAVQLVERSWRQTG